MRKIIKISLMFTLSILSVCTGSFAVDGVASVQKISLDRAVGSALITMEDIKISVVETEKAQHVYKEAQASRYPDLKAHATWVNNARYPVNHRYPEGYLSDYEAGAGATLQQVIWSFGRISSAVEAAEKNVEVGALNEQVKKADVIFNVKSAYYTLIYAQRAKDIVLESYQNSLDNKKILENRSAMGRVSRKDNIKIEADIAARIPLVTNVEADILSAKNTLKRIMGLDLGTEIEIVDIFTEDYERKNYDTLVDSMRKKEPTLKMLEKSISMRNSMLKAEKAEYMPNIAAFATWDYSGRSDDNKYWCIGHENLMDQFGVIGLQVEVPVFEFGRIGEKVKQAEKDKEKSILDFQKASHDLNLELSNAVSEYNEYIKTLEANMRSVDLSEKSFRLFQDLFGTGQVTLLELNDAELSLTNQKIAKETTLYYLNVTLARIERLIAEGVEE